MVPTIDTIDDQNNKHWNREANRVGSECESESERLSFSTPFQFVMHVDTKPFFTEGKQKERKVESQ